MNRKLDIEKWERKEQYNFFKNFDEPFFGVTIELDCTRAYAYCKEKACSFFLYYLHKSLTAANNIEEFKYRIVNNEVLVFEKVQGSATISRPNGTFGFSYMDYFNDFFEFEKNAKKEIDRVKNSTELMPAVSGENVIHYSSIPWINFTSLSHARNFSFEDSCPKISFGKMIEKNGEKKMAVAIHVHHALMDGFHLSKFIDNFQDLMNENNL